MIGTTSFDFPSLQTVVSFFGPVDQGSSEPDWSLAVDELLRIRQLQDDWDGEGSPAPGAKLTDAALTLAQSLQQAGIPSPGRVLSSVNGTIYFEWHSPGSYQEMEFLTPNEAEFRLVRKGSNTSEIIRLSRSS